MSYPENVTPVSMVKTVSLQARNERDFFGRFCTVPSMKFYNQYPGFIEKPLELRSLHCIGERDPWKDRASYFAEHAFDSSTREVFVHSGNHKPPSIFEKRDGVFDTVAEFLKK